MNLVTALARLARTANGEFTIDEMLKALCVVAVRALEVSGAGVMIAESGNLRFVHAEPERIASVERLQEVLKRGPCRDILTLLKPVVVEDITKIGRWPGYQEAAIGAGIAATVAIPLQARGQVWGVLDLYRDSPWAWTEEELSVAGLFADVACSYLVMASDRNHDRAAQRDLEHLATHDELTGLPNRTLLYDLLDHAIANAGRRGTHLSVLFIDVDRFKYINDTLGHVAGDVVLVEVARRVAAMMRDSDILARLSGDEFVAVCEDFEAGPAEVEEYLSTLRGRVDRVLNHPPVHVAGVDLALSVSIGATVTNSDRSAQDLLSQADKAMYLAKRRGRGRPVRTKHGAEPAFGSRRELEQDLHQALGRGELQVHYQPIVVPDANCSVAAVEALLRWEHPGHGLLPASAFIEWAERSGAIADIGKWVIDQACSQLRSWRDALNGFSPAKVFVNLSPREITNPDLADTLAAALAKYEIPASCLGLEIVEDNFIDPYLVSRLTGHQQHGHPLVIDDFGSGYSSLGRLVDLPVKYAKIDRSFVSGLPHDERRRKLVEAIIVVAHRLDIDVIAEGVETQEQVAALTDSGCDLLQGFHLGYPQDGDALKTTWTSQNQRRHSDRVGSS
jgi:diguanylate cyclase (GGDEF)-like protein